jgi:glutaredoxin
MKQPNVTIYGSRNCGDTVRATQLLDKHEIPYEFKDVDESPEFNTYIANLNNGVRKMPVIQIDNAVMIDPSVEELAKAVEQAAAVRE